MFFLSVADLALILVALIFVVLEWSYRAKRDGKKEATGAMLFAASVLAVAFTSEHLIKGSGPVAAMTYLAILFVYVFAKRHLFRKSV